MRFTIIALSAAACLAAKTTIVHNQLSDGVLLCLYEVNRHTDKGVFTTEVPLSAGGSVSVETPAMWDTKSWFVSKRGATACNVSSACNEGPCHYPYNIAGQAADESGSGWVGQLIWASDEDSCGTSYQFGVNATCAHKHTGLTCTPYKSKGACIPEDNSKGCQIVDCTGVSDFMACDNSGVDVVVYETPCSEKEKQM